MHLGSAASATMLFRTAGIAVLAARACLAGPGEISFLPIPSSDYSTATTTAEPDIGILEDIIEALTVLQDDYFQSWVGMWPSSIDWTGAVIGSHISGALETLSQGLELIRLSPDEDYRVKQNLISRYFSQLVAYYFGQDYFALRNEAYDDILWVVLGWLDTIQFIKLHNKLHYQLGSLDSNDPTQHISTMLRNQSWYGGIWTPAFAHRARTFWDLAANGWDTELCGGGMNWNPRLEPYKNAITNELFISASVAMYQFFPGDKNSAPFGAEKQRGHQDPPSAGPQEWSAHDPKYLAAALDGYKWLTTVGLMNDQGLYTDGFHISGYRDPKSNNTKCDARDNMVYTYNQGVVLSGQRGLFRSTGSIAFLEDGHRLIQSVIGATGYDLRSDSPVDDLAGLRPEKLPRWHGLGRAGILEEACDSRGDCSQDSQTFKGIFFHHFVAFCSPLDDPETLRTAVGSPARLEDIRLAHATACRRYARWLQRNAAAALATRDSRGKFGTWWTVGLLNITLDSTVIEPDTASHDDGTVDYRTYGVPNDPAWISDAQTPFREDLPRLQDVGNQQPVARSSDRVPIGPAASHLNRRVAPKGADPNNRGRGRTVETQGGGLAVVRALWEILRL